VRGGETGASGAPPRRLAEPPGEASPDPASWFSFPLLGGLGSVKYSPLGFAACVWSVWFPP
jgi:hypothetical protein